MQLPILLMDLNHMVFNEATGLVRVAIARTGEWAIGIMKVLITRQDLLNIIKNFRKERGQMMIHYGDAVRSGMGLLPAPGWLRSIEDAPDGAGVLWGSAELTEGARERIAKGEYQYLAPTIDWKAVDRATGTEAGATLSRLDLISQPEVYRLPAIRLTEGVPVPEKGRGGMRGVPDQTIFDSYDKLSKYLCDLTKQRVAEKGLDFRAALSEIAAENPALMKLREGLYMQDQTGLGSSHYVLVQGQLKQVEQDLEGMIAEAMKEHPEFMYSQALELTASEHPETWRRREGLRRQLHG